MANDLCICGHKNEAHDFNGCFFQYNCDCKKYDFSIIKDKLFIDLLNYIEKCMENKELLVITSNLDEDVLIAMGKVQAANEMFEIIKRHLDV